MIINSQQFSPKEVAQALGVSEATIKRWVDKNKLPAEKTLGGHRKITLKNLRDFCTASKYSIQKPEVLGLTASTGRQKDKIRIAQEELNTAFNTCSEEKIRGLLTNLALAEVPFHQIFDTVLTPALHQLGCDWYEGTIDAFQERRTIQICTRLLYSFESFFETPKENAPIALLGTLKNDPYIIPILMLETILRSKGWRTEFLGNDLELSSYGKAIELYQPELLAISCSGEREENELAQELRSLADFCDKEKPELLVGGRYITEEIIASNSNIHFPKSMTDFYEILSTEGLLAGKASQ